jgi:hypothetical protein
MEMLNIGKPFYLEGIGTITKNKAGKFDFSPGEYSMIRENNPSGEKEKKKLYARDKKEMNIPANLQNKNLLRLLVVLIALAIVGWGGWEMYKKSGVPVVETPPDTSSSTATSARSGRYS